MSAGFHGVWCSCLGSWSCYGFWSRCWSCCCSLVYCFWCMSYVGSFLRCLLVGWFWSTVACIPFSALRMCFGGLCWCVWFTCITDIRYLFPVCVSLPRILVFQPLAFVSTAGPLYQCRRSSPRSCLALVVLIVHVLCLLM